MFQFPGDGTARKPPESTLARSQAERRRRVLAATFELAADGGFDAVQMRDVAAAADVALGTVYRYFSSKERLLLEAMAEQQSDLRAYIETHPLAGDDAADRVMSVLRRSNRSLRRYPDVTAAMVRAFGSAQAENADIVQRVTELMTAIITRAVQGSERARADRPRGARRAHPHAGVALVAQRLGVRGRRPRPRRRGPRRRRPPVAGLGARFGLSAYAPTRAVCPEVKRVLLSRPMSVTRHYNFADLFELAADKVPDRVAIIDKRRQVTFRELDERSTRFAHALQAAGVKAGDHVGVLATNCIEWVEAMYGIYKIRARVVNVNFRYVEEEMRYLFDNSDLVALVYQREYGPLIVIAARDAQPKLQHFFRIEWDGSDADDSEARAGRVRGRDRVGLAGARLRRALRRRRLPPLHRRHHGHAQGRDVAPGRRVLRARRRHRRAHERARHLAARGQRQDRPVGARGGW